MSDEERFITEGKKVFKYRAIAIYFLYGGIVISFPIWVVFSTIFDTKVGGFFAIASIMISFIISIVLDLIYWKCPKCERNFAIRHGDMDDITHCPYCGTRLRYKDYPNDNYI
ncbi:hypothetical protein [Clostridium ganghwense]|uniref:Zinc ribbon domain-containing protein n=1 Tax=Clostridium ganghwense TaxID=312089 RepID=A0ABT4CUV5_9CLOT|nr:hypothetical protein [Clostridium ganghwense]MCY6372223.1 hypothetical protein [Clostridium ganghwense]